MATPEYVRASLVGTLPGSEVFSASWCYGVDGGATQTDLDGLVDDIHDALSVAGVAGGIRDLLNANSSFTKITGYYYSAGSTAASLYSEESFVAAGQSGTAHSNQSALVVTTLTGQAGRRKRGRIYLPANGIVLANDSQVPQEALDAVATTMHAAMVAPQGNKFSLAVISRVGSMATHITSIRIDSRLDVQRRRANKQLALRRATAITN